MEMIAAGFLSILLVAPTAPPQGEVDARPFREPNHIIFAVSRIRAEQSWDGLLYTDPTGRYALVSYGSGCLVSKDGHILTANHVVTGGELYLVGGWPGTSAMVPAAIVKRDEAHDLAVVRVAPPVAQFSYLTLDFVDTTNLAEGMDVFMWGCLSVPGAFMQFLRKGSISNLAFLSGSEPVLFIESSAGQGTSGSPAFLRGGQPIGVVSTSIRLPGGGALPAGVLGIVPGQRVNELLLAAKVRTRASP